MIRLTLILLIAPLSLFSQNVGIGTSNPEESATLEVHSNAGGVLIPRLTTAERDAIPSPASGLLIYNSQTTQFEFYNGSAWGPIASASASGNAIADADGDTKVETESAADIDKVQVTAGGQEILEIDSKTIHVKTPRKATYVGEDAGAASNTDLDNWNTYIGYKSGEKGTGGSFNTLIGGFAGAEKANLGNENVMVGLSAGYENEGDNNTFVGRDAGRESASGSNNTFIGHDAGRSAFGNSNLFLGKGAGENCAGNFNIALGSGALSSQLSGSQNIAIGGVAGGNTKLGSNNIFIGNEAGSEEDGSNNTFIGIQSGFSNGGQSNTYLGYQSGEFSTGSQNVFIGTQAGRNESGSEKLHISNNADNPLIYGEFDNERVFVNRKTPISLAESFGVRSEINSPAFGGMYMETNGNSNGKPFYGFAIDGSAESWIYHDGSSDELRFFNSGERFSISNSGSLKINNSYTLPINSGTSNQVLTSDGSGGTSWTTVTSGGGQFEDNSGTVRQVGGYNHNYLFGSATLPVNGTSIGGNFFFYDKGKGAFRGGGLLGSEAWSPSNIGQSSFAYGTEVAAKGAYSQALGLFTFAGSYGETALGISNVVQSNPSLTQWQANDFLFGIGNASTFGQRSNAFTIYKDGDMIVGNITGSSIPAYKFQINSEPTENKPFGINVSGNNVFAIDLEGDLSSNDINASGHIDGVDYLQISSTSSSSSPFIRLTNNNSRTLELSLSPSSDLASLSFFEDLAIGNEILIDNDTTNITGVLNIKQKVNQFINDNIDNIIDVTDRDGERSNIVALQTSAGGNNLLLGDIDEELDHVIIRNGGIDAVYINDNGNVGIGTQALLHKFHVGIDDAVKPNGGLWGGFSDRRLKYNIEDFSLGVDLLQKFRPVSFQYNELSGYDTLSQHIGLIAQEVKEIAPFMVEEREDGYLTLNSTPLIYIMLNAISEQNALVQTTQEEIIVIKKENEILMQKIEKLEKFIDRFENRFQDEKLGLESKLEIQKTQ